MNKALHIFKCTGTEDESDGHLICTPLHLPGPSGPRTCQSLDNQSSLSRVKEIPLALQTRVIKKMNAARSFQVSIWATQIIKNEKEKKNYK